MNGHAHYVTNAPDGLYVDAYDHADYSYPCVALVCIKDGRQHWSHEWGNELVTLKDAASVVAEHERTHES